MARVLLDRAAIRSRTILTVGRAFSTRSSREKKRREPSAFPVDVAIPETLANAIDSLIRLPTG